MKDTTKFELEKKIISENELKAKTSSNIPVGNPVKISQAYHIIVIKITIAMLLRCFSIILFGASENDIFDYFFVDLTILIAYLITVCLIAIYSRKWGQFGNNCLAAGLFFCEVYFFVMSDFGLLTLSTGFCLLITLTFGAINEKLGYFSSSISKVRIISFIFLVGIFLLLWLEFLVESERDISYLLFNKMIGAFFFSLWSVFYLEDIKNHEILNVWTFSAFFLIDILVVIEYVWRTLVADFKYMNPAD